MSAVRVLLGSWRRRWWRSWITLALIIGALAGLTVAVAAGARRADAAYPSLVRWSKAPDIIYYTGHGTGPGFADFRPQALSRLPQTFTAATVTGYNVLAPAEMSLLAPQNGKVPAAFWRRKMLAGRLPDPRQPAEVDIPFTLAQARHLHVGGMLRAVLLTDSSRPVSFTFRIVGIEATPDSFPPQTGTGTDPVWGTPAFFREHRSGLQELAATALRLRHGAAGIPAVEGEVTHLARGRPFYSTSLAVQASLTEHSIHLQVVALWIIAGLLGLAGLLICFQLMTRQSFLEAVENASLRAIGMSRRQLFAASTARAAVIGAAGGCIAALLAVVLSPVFPLGLARTAEPYPGIDLDPRALLAVFLTTTLLAVAAAWPAWRVANASAGREMAASSGRRTRASLLTWSTRSVTAMIGVRLALQPGAGRSTLPVRTTITAAVLGITSLAGTLIFSASLGHLLVTPKLYGVTWDAVVTNGLDSPITPAVPAAAHDPQVAAWSAGYEGVPVTAAGVRVDTIAMSPRGRGASGLPLITGREPRLPDEIDAGSQTMAALHSHVGGTVAVTLDGRSRPVRIVGVAVFPTLSDNLGLGRGIALTIAGLHRLLPPATSLPAPDTLLVRFRSGIARQNGIDALASRVSKAGAFIVQGPATPAGLVNFGGLQDFPLIIGIAPYGLVLLTIIHLLVTSTRRRRQDFAMLRTLGFTRGQVLRTVAWQGATLTATALIIGIPLGTICGRLAWRIFAGQLGITPADRIPLLALGLLIPLTLAVTAAAAVPPGVSASRAHIGRLLRTE